MLDIFLKDPKCFVLDISLTDRRKKKQICNKGSLFLTFGLVSVKHTVGGIVFYKHIFYFSRTGKWVILQDLNILVKSF